MEIETTSQTMDNSQESEIMPIGLLSGYQQFSFDPSKNNIYGEFTISVTGTYALYAGWTIKTSFPQSHSTDTSSYFYLVRPDGSKLTNQVPIGLNSEKGNMTIFNVPTGTYKVCYYINSTVPGTVQIWIY